MPLLAVWSLLLLRLLLWSAGTSIHCRMEGSASGFFTSGDCLSPSSWSGVYLMLAARVSDWAEGRGGVGGMVQFQACCWRGRCVAVRCGAVRRVYVGAGVIW